MQLSRCDFIDTTNPMNFIHLSKSRRVTTITLNRPAVMNAINPEMQDELRTAIDEFAENDEQYICVLTGAGERAFCAGTDLKSPGRGHDSKYCYCGLIERFDLAKPVIAAVNGAALGGGFELALACDLIIASANATFGLPEPLVGALAAGGGLHRLPRQIGLKSAMGFILSSRAVSAEEGLRLGFVNEVAQPGDLKTATHQWCDDILRSAPLAIRASKETAMRGLDEPSLESALRNQASYPSYVRWDGSDEVREGAAAFTQKRPPVWSV
jgi:enoyl-CoA hydratase/carnithine racemase